MPSEQIPFPKPPPKLANRFGLVLMALSGIFLLVTRFLEMEHPVIKWGPLLAVPLFVLGFLLVLYRKGQIVDRESKSLIHTKGLLGIVLKKRPQSLSDFTRVRLSEDQVKPKGTTQTFTVYRLFLEGKSAPALLAVYDDENEAKQRTKAISSFTELPISWPQV